MTFLLECTVASILKCLEEEVRGGIQKSKKTGPGMLVHVFCLSGLQHLPIDQSMQLLQAVLNFNTNDPLILSCVLTNISTLFPFAVKRPHFLPRVIYKVSLAPIGLPVLLFLIFLFLIYTSFDAS